jgi:hypothetical protein
VGRVGEAPLPGLFKWGGRKAEEGTPAPVTGVEEPAFSSKVLPKFLSALSSAPSPVLLNLGPVIGQNISFFGEQLSCKIFVEDLYADVEAFARQATTEGLAEALEGRLAQAPASLDGILCWDIFDYLDKKTGPKIAARLVSLLKPGGVIYGFFGMKTEEIAYYTRFIVDSKSTLRTKQVPGTRRTRNVLVNRDINKMFEGLVVAESVLLKSATRETLFRKPSA